MTWMVVMPSSFRSSIPPKIECRETGDQLYKKEDEYPTQYSKHYLGVSFRSKSISFFNVSLILFGSLERMSDGGTTPPALEERIRRKMERDLIPLENRSKHFQQHDSEIDWKEGGIQSIK